MTQTINLNENESKVLQSLINQVKECTGDEFGYIEDANRCGLTKHQFAGYISSLSQKGIFEYLTDEFGGQYAIKEEFFN